MELVMAAVDFVREHASELSVGIGICRLAVDTVRGVRSLVRRHRTNRSTREGEVDGARGPRGAGEGAHDLPPS
ncbi:hypothetical protein [Streptomyces sp. UH6]|uniref:hypothetical protein n=1 Tax=Streptomyces sp. UH6 TaxID=2748379 RepID=UPI0015D506D2|nr:hypothetical protein [Streptomyces sp. UH6]NYV75445.1 hypothetical protein [Streptomyces sp. UH6]